jgi:3-methyladenine DNA glycosylase AlkC
MYTVQYVADLAATIQAVYPSFEISAFTGCVFDAKWEGRELKARMRHITLCLHEFIPADFREALGILRRAAPQMDAYGFQNTVFSDYVEVFGLDDWEAAMPALEQFTQIVSAEFAIRPFIERYPERTLARMLEWARNDNVHLRRLSTEGCRPRLPWGIALNALRADPAPVLPILEQLKCDEAETVRRSVSNNLNDISKDNPGVVIEVLRRWRTHETKEMRWLTEHALRTLIKAGHPEALELLGYPRNPAIVVSDIAVTPQRIPMGSKVTLSFAVTSTSDRPQNLMVDFVVYLLRANGKHTPKVFKLAKRTVEPAEVLRLKKNIGFQPVTVRKYYTGEHFVAPKINGNEYKRAAFVLEDPD